MAKWNNGKITVLSFHCAPTGKMVRCYLFYVLIMADIRDMFTVRRLIQYLQPDIYFKGADYTLDQIPEVPTALSYSGEVKLIPLTQGYSTTHIIEQIIKPAA